VAAAGAQALICGTISHNAARGTRGWGTSGHPQPDVVEFVDWNGTAVPDGSPNGSTPATTAALAYVRARLPASLFDGVALPPGPSGDTHPSRILFAPATSRSTHSTRILFAPATARRTSTR
jgi:hypothetical protein